jgi:hypothetical protein
MVFYNVTTCSLEIGTNVLKENIASTFKLHPSFNTEMEASVLPEILLLIYERRGFKRPPFNAVSNCYLTFYWWLSASVLRDQKSGPEYIIDLAQTGSSGGLLSTE